MIFHCLSHADTMGREASRKMRFRSGESEVSVRIFEKAMNSWVSADREPPARAVVLGNQVAGVLKKEAFQPSKKKRAV